MKKTIIILILLSTINIYGDAVIKNNTTGETYAVNNDTECQIFLGNITAGDSLAFISDTELAYKNLSIYLETNDVITKTMLTGNLLNPETEDPINNQKLATGYNISGTTIMIIKKRKWYYNFITKQAYTTSYNFEIYSK